MLSDWPMRPSDNWLEIVNGAETDQELEALRNSVNCSQPYGSDSYLEQLADKLGLSPTMRQRGRPRRTTSSEGLFKKLDGTPILQKGS
jgi:hypothetical protein